MANVAFLFTGVGSLAGGGGAERFFSDFYDRYLKSERKHELFFITDKISLGNFKSLGSLGNEKNVLTFKIVHNRFKNMLEAFEVTRLIIKYKIKLIQIPLYNIHYYPLLRYLDKLPSGIRPKLIFTMTDSFTPHYYFDDKGRNYNFKGRHEALFNNVRIDSVISWYKLFTDFVKEHNLIKSQPKLFHIVSRYAGKTFNEQAVKKNNIIYVGRLTLAKRPLMFIEAIRILKGRVNDLHNWNFFVYGQGHLEQEVRQKIKDYGLGELVTVSHGIDLTHAFEEAKCFVSTQDIENFPSLSMNEAMAAGNCIIARNVGQTNLFVKDGQNGILLKKDDEYGLADAIEYYIKHPEVHECMAKESIRLTKEVHTYENYKQQQELFWDKTLSTN